MHEHRAHQSHEVSALHLRPLIAAIGAVLAACTDPMPPSDVLYDLRIDDAWIVDGTGAEGYAGHVLVADGMIVYAGSGALTAYAARDTVDAAGRVLAPGFIDLHAHGSEAATPEWPNFLAQGVTTIVLGLDGSSAGPGDPARPSRLSVLRFVGHGDLREAAGLNHEPEPDAGALARLEAAADSALGAGAMGISLGLEYRPGAFAGARELAVLGQAAARAGVGLNAHLRSEDDDRVEASLREFLAIGAASGAQLHVSHLKIVFGRDPAQADRLLALIDSAGATADVYPYTASYTGIGIVYPDWALSPADFESIKRTRRPELREYLRARVTRRNGPEATRFGTAPWTGRTLAEIADSMGIPFEDVLIDHIPPGSASAAYTVMDECVMRRFLAHPRVAVASDGSPTMGHPRGYGSFARVIHRHTGADGLTLPEAIRKMTSLPASILGLTDRGRIATGLRADLVLFDPAQVRDSATYTEPHRLAQGFDAVWVAGERVRQSPSY